MRPALVLLLLLGGLVAFARATDDSEEDCELGAEGVEWDGRAYVAREIDPPRPPAGRRLEGGTEPSGCGERVRVRGHECRGRVMIPRRVELRP